MVQAAVPTQGQKQVSVRWFDRLQANSMFCNIFFQYVPFREIVYV